MDFRTTAAGYQYGVRASALIIHAGKLLTYSHDGKYFVPGALYKLVSTARMRCVAKYAKN